MRFVVYKVALSRGFLRVLRLPSQYHATNDSYFSSFHQKDKRDKRGDHEKKTEAFEISAMIGQTRTATLVRHGLPLCSHLKLPNRPSVIAMLIITPNYVVAGN